MIAGRYDEDRAPRIDAVAWFPRTGIRREVALGIDPMAATTRVSTGVLLLPGESMAFPPDDWVEVMVDGRAAVGVQASLVLTFASSDGVAMVYTTATIFEGGAEESRLGRDILNEWLMVYDPKGDSLLFEAV